MGVLRKIKENELIGGYTDTDIYPVTSTRAVFDNRNISVDTLFKSSGIPDIETVYGITDATIPALDNIPASDRKLGFICRGGHNNKQFIFMYIGNSTSSWGNSESWIQLSLDSFERLNDSYIEPVVNTNPKTYKAYLATSGTYSAFNNIQVSNTELAILYYKNGWNKFSIPKVSPQNSVSSNDLLNEYIYSTGDINSSRNVLTTKHTKILKVGSKLCFRAGFWAPESVGGQYTTSDIPEATTTCNGLMSVSNFNKLSKIGILNISDSKESFLSGRSSFNVSQSGLYIVSFSADSSSVGTPLGLAIIEKVNQLNYNEILITWSDGFSIFTRTDQGLGNTWNKII